MAESKDVFNFLLSGVKKPRWTSIVFVIKMLICKINIINIIIIIVIIIIINMMIIIIMRDELNIVMRLLVFTVEIEYFVSGVE